MDTDWSLLARFILNAQDPLPALNAFTACHSSDWARAWINMAEPGWPGVERLTSGSVSLAAAPDYDTGALKGLFTRTISGTDYSGSFDTAYCPVAEGLDLEALAQALFDQCYLVPEIPFEPGTTSDEIVRDAVRGLRAAGLTQATADCYQAAPASRAGRREHWTPVS